MLLTEQTCLKRAVAPRAGVLIDGASYYGALRTACLAAQRTIMIAGWDVDTRTELMGEAPPSDGYPTGLLAFFNALLEDRPGLDVYVLAWDFSVIYALEREKFPSFTFATEGHERLHFVLDGRHPAGASHHQKLVVIDDQLAFLGGLDLTIRRWDTRSHRSHELRRVDPEGEPYEPFHDLQIFVDGEPAEALGELFRERWVLATGEHLPFPELRVQDITLPCDVLFENATTGIARTVPPLDEGEPAVCEVLQLSIDAIRSAKDIIYIENQYLTSQAIGDALVARLAEPDCPHIFLILPKVQSGWLEKNSMGALRARLLERLRAHDDHKRLHAYCPLVSGGCITVHSKLIVVDDRFMKLGSANLSNRSMGLDTECDLAIEAPDDAPRDHPTRVAMRELVAQLFAEHLGVSIEEVTRADHEPAALLALIRAREGEKRSLQTIQVEPSTASGLGPLEDIADPERPIELSELLDELGAPEPRKKRTLLESLWSLVSASAALVLGASWWNAT